MRILAFRSDSILLAKAFGGESYPRWSMIARFLPAPYFALNPAGSEHRRRSIIRQEMVNPDSSVASKGTAEVVPKGVYRLVGMEVPECIGPAL